MLVECLPTLALEHGHQSCRLCQSKDAEPVQQSCRRVSAAAGHGNDEDATTDSRRIATWSADDGDGFWQGLLVSRMRVQVHRRHEAGLRRVRVYLPIVCPTRSSASADASHVTRRHEQLQLTQPRAINPRSSCTPTTRSSSFIVHVSDVPSCRGINNARTSSSPDSSS